MLTVSCVAGEAYYFDPSCCYESVFGYSFDLVILDYYHCQEAMQAPIKGYIGSGRGKQRPNQCHHIELYGHLTVNGLNPIQYDDWIAWLPANKRASRPESLWKWTYSQFSWVWLNDLVSDSKKPAYRRPLAIVTPDRFAHYEVDCPFPSQGYSRVHLIVKLPMKRSSTGNLVKDPDVDRNGYVIRLEKYHTSGVLDWGERRPTPQWYRCKRPVPPITEKLWPKEFAPTRDYAAFLAHKITRWPDFNPFPENKLVVDCMKDIKELDINTVTAVKGLFTLWKDIKGLIAAANGHVSAKWLDGVYLYMKYGLSNSVRDSIEIMKWAKEEARKMLSKYSNRQITHSTKGVSFKDVYPKPFTYADGYEKTTLTVCAGCLDVGAARILKGLMDIDVFPELGNIWDVIPFSFVIDWFIPFGDLFDAIDANTYKSTLQCHYTTISHAYEFTNIALVDWLPQLTGVSWTGSADVRYYERLVSDEIPTPSLELQVPQRFTQWIPAGALIFQALAKRK